MLRRYSNYLIFAFLILLSFYAGSKLLSTAFFTSHDGPGHVIRIIDFHESFKEGQIPVRISKRLDNGLGYPFYNFNYPLVYYLSEPFMFAGINAVSAFKALLFISIITGALGMYFFAREYFGKAPSFVAATFYIFAPYRFLDVYVRGNVGEALGLSMLPVFLLSILLVQRRHRIGALLFVASLSFLILIHNITAMFGFGIGVVLYGFNVLVLKRKPCIKTLMMSLFFVIGLTAFFIVPVAIETRLTRLPTLGYEYENFFPSLKEIIYSPWGFGLWKSGPYPGKMSPQLGLIHELVSFLAIGVLLLTILKRKVKSQEKITVFFTAVIIVSLFLTLPASRIIWSRIYFLQVIQMPWRFVGYATLGASLLAGYFVSKVGRIQFPVLFFLVALVLYANRNHISVNQYISFTNPFNQNGVYWHSTAAYAEHTPAGVPIFSAEPNHNGDIIYASGSATRTQWKSNYQRFVVNLDKGSYFRNNIYYFPGWTATIDGKQAPIQYNKDPLRRLYIYVPQGHHIVEFRFGETWYRAVGDVISVVTLLIGLIFLITHYRNPKGYH